MNSKISQREIHPAPAPQLAPLAFLIGRLHGEGWVGDPTHRYTKDVSGSWAVGGHHLLLDMSAEYFLDDEIVDRHSVLVVLSAGLDEGALTSRAYNDTGGFIDYEPTTTADGLEFGDRVPHGVRAACARKILRFRDFGYEETLEVDRGDGAFVPYSSIELRRR